MRLSTLARKINKTPNQLIAFLEEKKIVISNGLHSKLESETVDMVYNHFVPEQIIAEAEIVDEIDKEIEEKNSVEIEEIEIPEIEDEGDKVEIIEKSDEKEVEEKIEKIENHEIEEKIDGKEIDVETEEKIDAEIAEKIEADIPVSQETNKEQKTGTLDDLENDNSIEIELIKAKKVKLDGIKVVGKIELPEKPKKGIVESENVELEVDPVKSEEKPIKSRNSVNRKFDRNRKKSQRGRNRNPLTYEEKLKKEEREALKKRRQKNKEEKLRKKKYYQKNIKPKTNPKPKRTKKKQTENQANEKALVYKNPVKKLWAWLNGKYDSY